MSEESTGRQLKDWLQQRLGIREILDFLMRKEVPLHRHTKWYFAGSAILLFFTLQVITGFLLVLYYRPTLDEAHSSVARITTEIPFGWVVRSIHHWSANFMIAAVTIHLFSTWLTKAYRSPRELTWMSGAVLLGFTLGFGFTGYLLPWDELALAATKVGSDIPRSVPLIGDWITSLLRGGDDVTGDTLSRFYGFHVCILPAGTLLLLGIHIFLIQRQGVSIPISEEAKEGPPESLPFWPCFVYREMVVALVLFGLLLTVSVLFPPSLGKEADFLAPAPEGIRPEWYFLFMFQTLKVFPASVLGIAGETLAVLLMGVVGVLFFFFPFLDNRPRERKGRILTGIGWASIAYILIMTAWSFL